MTESSTRDQSRGPMAETELAMDWKREIEELHDFFQRYLGGDEESLERLESVLEPGFVIIPPGGQPQNRDQTVAGMAAAKGNVGPVDFETTDHRLVAAAEDLVVASYVEHQQSPDSTTQRWSTVTFRPEPTAPNGVVWVHLHETWIPGGEQ